MDTSVTAVAKTVLIMLAGIGALHLAEVTQLLSRINAATTPIYSEADYAPRPQMARK